MAIYGIGGTALNDAYALDGTALDNAYSVEGDAVFDKDVPAYSDYEITSMFTYSANSLQGFAYSNGVIAQCREGDALHMIDLETQTLLYKVTMSFDHGNSAQFSNEYYAQDDAFPLFYVRANGIYVYRIVGTGSELIHKYSFPTAQIGTYASGFGVDSVNRRIYTVSYTEGDYTTKTGLCRFCAWDMDNYTVNENGYYVMNMLYSHDSTWFDIHNAIQGCCYHDGYLFVGNGYSSGAQYVTLFDVTDGTIYSDIPLGSGEVEGCAWVDDDYLIVGQKPTNISYSKITFA